MKMEQNKNARDIKKARGVRELALDPKPPVTAS
jgi:hypothetical protein